MALDRDALAGLADSWERQGRAARARGGAAGDATAVALLGCADGLRNALIEPTEPEEAEDAAEQPVSG